MPLPPGYTLDEAPASGPKLPAGYTLDAPETDTTATPPAPATTPPSFWQSMKDKMASNIESNSQPIVGDHSPSAVLHNIGAKAGSIVTSLPGYAKDVGTAAIHSVKSGQPNELLDVLNPFDQIGAVTDQFKSDYAKDPALAFENLAGTGAGMAATAGALKNVPKVAGKAAGKVADVLPKVKSVTGPLKVAAEITTKTTPRATEEFVKSTVADNAAEVAKAAEKTQRNAERAAEINAQRAAKHAERVKTVEAQNQAAQAAADAKQAQFEADKSAAEEVNKHAAETDTQRGQLARQSLQTSSRLVNRVKTVAQSVKSQLDAAYGQIRQKTAGATLPGESLSNAVDAAQTKLKGSSESIKQFKDILSKYDDTSDPNTIEYQGAAIPKGNPLYDVLKEQGMGGEPPPPVTFANLQGYYSELGEKLAGGNLPGDVYHALRSLQDNIGSMMQKMANDNGAGAQFKLTQARYRDYMETFRENAGPNHSGSPIAQALLAEDPAYAIKPLTSPETSARVRNMLSRFDPPVAGQGGAAALYNNFLDIQRAYDKVSKPTKLQSLPTAPAPFVPKPAPNAPAPIVPKTILPKVTQLGPEDIQAMKANRVIAKGHQIADSSGNMANAIAGLGLARALITGNMSAVGVDIAARVAYGAAKQGVAKLLTHPGVVDWLSKPTPRDLEILQSLPPEQLKASAASMGPLVDAAQAKGVKVHPAIIALVGAGAGLGSNRKGVAAALTPSYNPSTHEWNAAQWQQQNPGGDVEAAKAQAVAQGFEVK